MRLVVIARHGNTFAADEQPRRIGSRTDLPLVASGLKQASQLGEATRRCGWTFDRVFAGPLVRARQTAVTIVSRSGAQVAVETTDWLDEIDHGPDEDQLEHAVIDRIGELALRRWEVDGTPPVGWHVSADKRLLAWRAFLAAPEPRRALLVTSSGSARYALLALPHVPRPPSLKLRTGAFGLLVRRQAGWSVAAWDIRP